MAREDQGRVQRFGVDEQASTPGGIWRLWTPLWSIRRAWNGHLFPVLTLLAMLLLLSPYLLINRIAAAGGTTSWDPKTLFVFADGTYLDHAIPVVDWSILFYYTIFAFYFGLHFAAPRTDRGRRELLLTIQCVAVSSWLAYLVFLLLPAEIDLRWQLADAGVESGWSAPLYEGFHWLDRPYNAWPSLHVTQTFLAAVAVAGWWRGRGRRFAVAALWITWTALAISTLTTKQHFLWDVLSGLGLGLLTWLLGLRPGLARSRKSPSARAPLPGRRYE